MGCTSSSGSSNSGVRSRRSCFSSTLCCLFFFRLQSRYFFMFYCVGRSSSELSFSMTVKYDRVRINLDTSRRQKKRTKDMLYTGGLSMAKRYTHHHNTKHPQRQQHIQTNKHTNNEVSNDSIRPRITSGDCDCASIQHAVYVQQAGYAQSHQHQHHHQHQQCEQSQHPAWCCW